MHSKPSKPQKTKSKHPKRGGSAASENVLKDMPCNMLGGGTLCDSVPNDASQYLSLSSSTVPLTNPQYPPGSINLAAGTPASTLSLMNAHLSPFDVMPNTYTLTKQPFSPSLLVGGGHRCPLCDSLRKRRKHMTK